MAKHLSTIMFSLKTLTDISPVAFNKSNNIGHTKYATVQNAEFSVLHNCE